MCDAAGRVLSGLCLWSILWLCTGTFYWWERGTLQRLNRWFWSHSLWAVNIGLERRSIDPWNQTHLCNHHVLHHRRYSQHHSFNTFLESILSTFCSREQNVGIIHSFPRTLNRHLLPCARRTLGAGAVERTETDGSPGMRGRGKSQQAHRQRLIY